MKKTSKLISMLLLAAMLFPACAQDGTITLENTTDTTTAETTITEETTVPDIRANHYDNLPQDLTFNGQTVTGLFRGTEASLDGTTSNYWIVNDVCGTDNVGDIVSDAVWKRNTTVSERLNVNLTWVPTGTGNRQAQIEIFKSAVLSGDDTSDFFLPTGNTSLQGGITAYMRDLSKIPYVDWEQPWWWQFANDALSLDGKQYHYVVGDMLLTNLAQTLVMYFNKDLYTDIYGNPDDMYNMVLDGEFTVDNLHTLVQGAYRDVDGDGTRNAGDIFGLIWSANKNEELSGWVVSMDLDLYTRDSDGKCIITMNNERTILAIEKLHALMNENEGSFSGSGGITAQNVPFSEGTSLFLAGRLISATTAELREMEQDYGILPVPMLDSDQEKYLSGVHNSGTVLCVPKSTGDEKFAVVGAVLEALCGEAHRTYIDAFLDTALKMKYSRDNLSGQCIDIILNGLSKNTLDDYLYYCSDITTTCIYESIKNKPETFVSAFTKVAPAAQKGLDDAVVSLQGES